jgi:hypothetical protein
MSAAYMMTPKERCPFFSTEKLQLSTGTRRDDDIPGTEAADVRRKKCTKEVPENF